MGFYTLEKEYYIRKEKVVVGRVHGMVVEI
jgi:hypothetical protein